MGRCSSDREGMALGVTQGEMLRGHQAQERHGVQDSRYRPIAKRWNVCDRSMTTTPHVMSFLGLMPRRHLALCHAECNPLSDPTSTEVVDIKEVDDARWPRGETRP